MAFNKNDKADGSKVRRGGMRRRKKVCVFCGEKNGVIDYKEIRFRERKDPSQKNYRKLRKAPESSDGCDQESTSSVPDALHLRVIAYLRTIWSAAVRPRAFFYIIFSYNRKKFFEEEKEGNVRIIRTFVRGRDMPQGPPGPSGTQKSA